MLPQMLIILRVVCIGITLPKNNNAVVMSISNMHSCCGPGVQAPTLKRTG